MATDKNTIELLIRNDAQSGTINHLTPPQGIDLSKYGATTPGGLATALLQDKDLSKVGRIIGLAAVEEMAKAINGKILNQFKKKDIPSEAASITALRRRVYFSENVETLRLAHRRQSPFNKSTQTFGLPYYYSPSDEPSGYNPHYNRGRISGGIRGGMFGSYTLSDPTGRLNEIANANAEDLMGIRNQTIAYRNIRTYKSSVIKKRTRAQEIAWQSTMMAVHESSMGTHGEDFVMKDFGGSTSSDAAVRNRLLLGYSPQSNVFEGHFTEMSAAKQADTIGSYLNKIFAKIGDKVNQMVGTSGYEAFNDKGKKVWVEGTGIAGRYSNPKNKALMRGAMIGSALNTIGDFASNYGNYINSRANVTSSFAADYYAGTANENFGNYLGGLVSSRSQFLQSQVTAGVDGAMQLGAAALLPLVAGGGILATVAGGAGLSQVASGVSSIGSAELNQYLKLGGAAFQQKAINLGNASVTSQYFGMSRWGGNTFQKDVIPKEWTMGGKNSIGLTMNKTLQAYEDDPFFNQLVAFAQTSNVDIKNQAHLRDNFTALRAMGITDTRSAARLGSMSNMYGAVTGNFNTAFDSLTSQLHEGQRGYGVNFNLDTLENSARIQSILGAGNETRAGRIAMQSQYFPEVGQAFNTATRSNFAQALTRNILWTASGFSGNLQDILTGNNNAKFTRADVIRMQGMQSTGADKLTAPLDIVGSMSFGADFNDFIRQGLAQNPGLKAVTTGTKGKSVGDDSASSTWDTVMSTPNMTVNATNVSLNWDASDMGIKSQFGQGFSPNDRATNLNGASISLPATQKPVGKSHTATKSTQKKTLR